MTTGQKSASSGDPKRVDALVVGGGIAGLQAALDLADQGFRVIVAERQPEHRRADDRAEQGLSHAGLRELHHHAADVGRRPPSQYRADGQHRGAVDSPGPALPDGGPARQGHLRGRRAVHRLSDVRVRLSDRVPRPVRAGNVGRQGDRRAVHQRHSPEGGAQPANTASAAGPVRGRARPARSATTSSRGRCRSRPTRSSWRRASSSTT